MKNTTSKKLNIFKTSPLICVVAILEIIILICVSTFAWFVYAENNTLGTDIISVEPDSGLEIDFNDANENDYINIWNYLNEFQFEPVTSLDGRNLFVPTTGTFFGGNTTDTPSSPENPGDTQNTYLIYFDTKGTGWTTPYIQCDYTHAEQDNIAMTRLNSTSTIFYYDLAPLINRYNYTLTYMKFKSGKGKEDAANITNQFGTLYNCIYPISANHLYKCELDSNGKAFQDKQANHSGLKVSRPEPYSGTVPDIGGSNSGNSGSGDGTGAVSDKGGIKFREATVNDMNSKYINIDFTLTNTGEEEMPVYLSSKSFFKLYDPVTEKEVNSKAIRIAFYQNDGSSGKITSSLLSKDYDGEVPEDPDDPDGGGTGGSTYTVYLDPPAEWTEASQIKAYVFGTSGSPFSFPGEVMQYDSSTGYYYYTADRKYNKVIFNYHGDQNQTVNLDAYDQGIYVLDDGRNGTWALDHIQRVGGTKVEDDGSSGSGSGNSGNTGESEGQTTVYFYNSLGWKQPYAYIWDENNYGAGEDGDDEKLSDWPGKPMTHISGAVYYYTFSSKYNSIIFNDGNDQGGAVKTGDIYPVEDGHIYMIGNPNADGTYGWELEDYVGTVDGGTYPVISPGVSTGFQRPYAPVTEIDDSSGKSKVVIPAFASSIDDYNFGSNNPLFTIAPKQTLPLSMVIWLEGTDPDCTEDVYSGKFIDMNLVFATKDSGEKMYTYQFLDKTKENWIDDSLTTDTGVTFKPVMQLYDAENHKGYLMSVHDDEAGKPTIWQCRAPKELSESEHIMFRRVNPMNEDEVWNYWDTNGFGGLSDEVKREDGVVLDEVVTFTAFADGSPTTALNEDGTHYDGAPDKSCGGLWGDHDTQLVTVYDGTNGQWIKNSEKEGTSSVLTMNFTYKGQQIEYKASSAYDKGMHYFIVPTKVYSKTNTSRPPVTFKRYFNFDGKYALNSDRNQLKYHMSWNAGVCNGKFFEITEDDKGNKFSYWGSDVLYIQAKNIVKNKFDDGFMQVHYYSTDSSTTDGTNDFYSYIYKNDAFKPDDGGYGYVSVIPSDRRYYYYRVERCDPKYHSSKWDVSPAQTIQYESTTNNAHSNTIDKNICSIENFQITLFLQLSTNYCWSGNDPQCYAWDDVGSNGNNSSNIFNNAPTMTYHANQPSGFQQYRYVLDISRYNAIIFHNQKYANNYKSQDFKGVGGVGIDRNGMIFQSASNQSDYVELLKNNDNSPVIMSGYKDNETMNAVLYDATGWDVNGS